MKSNTPGHRLPCFVLGVGLQVTALSMMAFDPVAYGFGPLSLDFGPVLLMLGIAMPVIGLSKPPSLKRWRKRLRAHPVQLGGGLVAVGIAFATYLSTLEPTASLWDCSETIAAAYKLQVPHTPGTPLTLLIGRLFSMLSLGNVFLVAWFVNLMSATFSALAVGLTFLIIWHFGAHFIVDRWILLIGSLGGSLCLAFSDSFWFSAVEAETYGPSIFCMLLLVWLAIDANKLQGSDRQSALLRLSYLAGLSYCIHPMCILILPVCVLLVRNREQVWDWRQVILSVCIGIAFILLISQVVAVAFFEWVFRLDLWLVNRWLFPFYSGVLVLVSLLAIAFLFIWKKVEKSRLLITSFVLVVLGFSPYLMLFIRSSQLPPINEFSPSNLAKIKPYMNRESYPSRPLLYGRYFDARLQSTSTKAQSYVVNDGRYEPTGEIPNYHYDRARMTILPRIYSSDPSHIATYREWTGLSAGETPRFRDNLVFMFRYQLGHMFGRYFLWNFAGRASDTQHAEWLAPWETSLDRSAVTYPRATNQYYMLPLLLGLLGLWKQYKRDRQGFITNFMVFLMTGLLLALYLNATPNEPRERDYIYVGCYAAFSIWIGMGIMAVAEAGQRHRVGHIAGILTCVVPLWMAYQNWDDHDRSNRTFQMDYARMVLGSCAPGAILFTGGDNDTFPLWYLQEVEGYRTDVRVKVMSYFNADWYINQLSRRYYDSPALQLSLQTGLNQYGPFDPLYIRERTQSALSWSKYVNALKTRNPQLMISNTSGGEYFILPSRRISLSTSKGPLDIKVSGAYLPKNELAILDILQSNDWTRPLYFNYTSLNGLKTNLGDYVSQEGLVYRLVAPDEAPSGPAVNIERSYENLVTKANYGNLADPSVYFNHEDYHMRMIVPLKFTFNTLIQHCFNSGDLQRVEELTHFAYAHLYFDHLEPSYADLQMARWLELTDQPKKAKRLTAGTFQYYFDKLSRQIDKGQDPRSNDLLVLQESTKMLRDSQSATDYRDLVARMSLRREGR